MSQIYIPKKLKIGYQKREGTYSNKLAYVIYYDEKGKLRKETSWESWRHKDIEPDEILNEPTFGFVLNKKVGDYSGYWGNHRHAYCRIFHPNSFEFEITIENLLYILENTSSIKGKGLEGEFVFGWDNKDLILIPCDSPDYKEISKFSETINSNNYIKSKDLKIGATYLSKQNEKYVYIGKFDFWDNDYNYDIKNYELKNKGKRFYFIDVNNINKDPNNYRYNYFDNFKSISNKFVSVIDENCHLEYADLFQRLESKPEYSPIDDSKDEWINYNFEEFEEKVNEQFKDHRYWRSLYLYDKNKKEVTLRKSASTDNFYYERQKENTSNYYSYYNTETIDLGKSVEEVFQILQPMYKNVYLTNGKFYRSEK